MMSSACYSMSFYSIAFIQNQQATNEHTVNPPRVKSDTRKYILSQTYLGSLPKKTNKYLISSEDFHRLGKRLT